MLYASLPLVYFLFISSLPLVYFLFTSRLLSLLSLSYPMPTILLTWWLWYIGSHCAVVLIQAWYDVVIIDNITNSNPNVLDGTEQITAIRPVWYQGDICDADVLAEIFVTHQIDAVIHFAAKKSVGESMEIPHEYYHNNITGTQTLLRVMDDHSVRNIVFSSTCAVYSPINVPPYTEEMSTGPESVYGMTKRINEEMIQWLVLAGKLDACVLRYFNPIGNHHSGLIGENPSQVPQNIMPIIMEVLEWKREYLTVFGDQYDTRDGTCIRDYIHVMDLAEAHVEALERLQIKNWKLRIKNLWIYEIVNLGTGSGTTVLEMVQAVEQALWKKLPYQIVAPRSWDLPAVYGDCSKAKKLLWRETNRTITQGVKDMWEFRKKK